MLARPPGCYHRAALNQEQRLQWIETSNSSAASRISGHLRGALAPWHRGGRAVTPYRSFVKGRDAAATESATGRSARSRADKVVVPTSPQHGATTRSAELGKAPPSRLTVAVEPQKQGTHLSTTVLTPIRQGNYWRVEIAWPDKRRLFGKFRSEADAQKWIEDHRWLTKRQEADDQPAAPMTG